MTCLALMSSAQLSAQLSGQGTPLCLPSCSISHCCSLIFLRGGPLEPTLIHEAFEYSVVTDVQVRCWCRKAVPNVQDRLDAASAIAMRPPLWAYAGRQLKREVLCQTSK